MLKVKGTFTLDKITPLGDLDMADIQIDKPQLWDVDHPGIIYLRGYCNCQWTENDSESGTFRFPFF